MTPADRLTAVQRWALGAVLVIALVARVGSALIEQTETFSPDERGYTKSAFRLLDRHFFSYKSPVPNARVTPGYPLFLAGVLGAWRAVAPDAPNAQVVRVVQALAGWLLVWLVFVLGRRYGGPWAGIGAAAFWAVYAGAFTAQNMRITEGVYAPLFIGAIIIAADGAEGGGRWRDALAGLLFGIATLLRPAAAPLLAVPYAVEWFQSKARRRRVVASAAIAAACLVVVLVPWTVRNAVVLKQFVPLATQGGDPLLRGSDPFDQYDHVGPSTILGVPPKDYTSVALARIAEGFRTDPLRYAAWYTAGKVWYMVREPWGGNGMFWPTVLHLVGVTFVGGMGVVHALRRRRLRWMAWVVVAGVALQLPFIPLTRYVYPLTPLVVALAAVFVADVARGDGGRLLVAGDGARGVDSPEADRA